MALSSLLIGRRKTLISANTIRPEHPGAVRRGSARSWLRFVGLAAEQPTSASRQSAYGGWCHCHEQHRRAAATAAAMVEEGGGDPAAQARLHSFGGAENSEAGGSRHAEAELCECLLPVATRVAGIYWVQRRKADGTVDAVLHIHDGRNSLGKLRCAIGAKLNVAAPDIKVLSPVAGKRLGSNDSLLDSTEEQLYSCSTGTSSSFF